MTIDYLVYKTCFYKTKTKYVLMEKKKRSWQSHVTINKCLIL